MKIAAFVLSLVAVVLSVLSIALHGYDCWKRRK